MKYRVRLGYAINLEGKKYYPEGSIVDLTEEQARRHGHQIENVPEEKLAPVEEKAPPEQPKEDAEASFPEGSPNRAILNGKSAGLKRRG